ncbi:MAG: zinc-ribbon domain-containing protein [Promethearchaeota archaeon]
MDENKFCSNCGTANPISATFCASCGDKFRDL